jgi:hypothetical protein
MIRALALAMLAALLLTGCGSRAWVQVAADARAISLAMSQTSDAAARAKLAAALGANVLAMTEPITDLPAPTWTPTELCADPDLPAKATAASLETPPRYEAPPPPPPSPADRLRKLGDHVLWWGGLAAAIGAALLAVGFLARWVPMGWIGWLLTSPIVSPIARLAASLGSASVVIGAAMSWLADWLWAIVLAGVVGLAIVAIVHRNDIRKAWRKLWAKPAGGG